MNLQGIDELDSSGLTRMFDLLELARELTLYDSDNATPRRSGQKYANHKVDEVHQVM